MTDRPEILLVDDDDFAASVTAEALASSFTVTHAENGQSALDQIAKKAPDLVLLDVSMPGLSGYEVCKKLREDSSLDSLPVIFLSGLVSDEERLAGYEAGGDDYLTKPVMMEELRRKIDLVLRNYAERRRLKEDLAGSFSTAMTAMTTAADMGNVLQFLRASYKCPDYVALSDEILNTLGSTGLKASVQIRGKHGVESRGNNGACSALEESVLANMAKQGRLFEFSSCLSCTYEHVTVIVKNLNQKERDAIGRLRDNLAILVEGADARVEALDAAVELEKKHHALTQLMASIRNALQDIDRRHKQQSLDSKEIFQNLQEEFERRLLTIGITISQEDELAEMIQNATRRAMALYDEGIATGEHMEAILKQLDGSAI